MSKRLISGALLDFLNVREWTPEQLLIFFKDHGAIESLYGHHHGHDAWVKSRAFPDKRFCLSSTDEAVVDLSLHHAGFILPEDPEYQIFADYLKNELRSDWIQRIAEYQDSGELSQKYMDHLRSSLTVSFNNDFSIHAYCNTCELESWLERDFFNFIAFGGGGIFKKFRECKNPECRQWFLYNRPKQEFCSDKCRRNYWNRKNIDSGYIRDFIRRKREEDPITYMPK